MMTGAAIKDALIDYGYTKPISQSDQKKLILFTNTTEDLAKYASPSLNKGDINLSLNYQYKISNNFFNDDPFLKQKNDVAKNYMSLVAKSTGAFKDCNLSFISHLNNLKTQITDSRVWGNPKNQIKIV